MALNLENILLASLSVAQRCWLLCVNLPTWMHRTMCPTATLHTHLYSLWTLNSASYYKPAQLRGSWDDQKLYTHIHRAAVNKLPRVHSSSRTWGGEGRRDSNLWSVTWKKKENLMYPCFCPEITGNESTHCVPSPPPSLGWGSGLGLEKTDVSPQEGNWRLNSRWSLRGAGRWGLNQGSYASWLTIRSPLNTL